MLTRTVSLASQSAIKPSLSLFGHGFCLVMVATTDYQTSVNVATVVYN